MKQILFTAAIALSAAVSGAPALDKGGVTFDFRKISAGLFKPAEVAKDANLVTNPDGKLADDPKDPLRWQPTYCYIHSNAIPDKDPRRAKTRQTVRWEKKEGVFTVVKPEELKSFLSPKLLGSTSGGWRKPVNLPHAKGGVYEISFQYKGKLTSAGAAYLLVSGFTETAGQWWKGKQPFFKVFRIALSEDYQNYKNALMLPPGVKSVELVPRIDGTGFLSIRNLAVTAKSAAKVSEKITLLLSPMGRLDHTFALAQKLPGTLTCVWKRNCWEAD
jgi:hypothetical protein